MEQKKKYFVLYWQIENKIKKLIAVKETISEDIAKAEAELFGDNGHYKANVYTCQGCNNNPTMEDLSLCLKCFLSEEETKSLQN